MTIDIERFGANSSLAEFVEVKRLARERLAQLSGECPKCQGTQWPDNLELPSLAPIPENPAVIVETYGKAGPAEQQWPAKTVERITKVLCRHRLDDGHNFECRDLAIAILDALNGDPS